MSSPPTLSKLPLEIQSQIFGELKNIYEISSVLVSNVGDSDTLDLIYQSITEINIGDIYTYYKHDNVKYDYNAVVPNIDSLYDKFPRLKILNLNLLISDTDNASQAGVQVMNLMRNMKVTNFRIYINNDSFSLPEYALLDFHQLLVQRSQQSSDTVAFVCNIVGNKIVPVVGYDRGKYYPYNDINLDQTFYDEIVLSLNNIHIDTIINPSGNYGALNINKIVSSNASQLSLFLINNMEIYPNVDISPNVDILSGTASLKGSVRSVIFNGKEIDDLLYYDEIIDEDTYYEEVITHFYEYPGVTKLRILSFDTEHILPLVAIFPNVKNFEFDNLTVVQVEALYDEYSPYYTFTINNVER